jgi:uncharacterized membrane protein YkoI
MCDLNIHTSFRWLLVETILTILRKRIFKVINNLLVASYIAIGLSLAATPAALAQAQEQDYAYQCVQSGKCLPLDRVVTLVKARVPGKFIGSEMDDAQARLGVYVYRLTFMKEGGEVTRVDVDAKSGRILSME